MFCSLSAPCPSLPQSSLQKRGRQASRSRTRKRGGNKRLSAQIKFVDVWSGRRGTVACAASEGTVGGSPSSSSELSGLRLSLSLSFYLSFSFSFIWAFFDEEEYFPLRWVEKKKILERIMNSIIFVISGILSLLYWLVWLGFSFTKRIRII